MKNLNKPLWVELFNGCDDFETWWTQQIETPMKTQTQNSTKHTPTPWRFSSCECEDGETGHFIETVEADPTCIAQLIPYQPSQCSERANAEFICQAVNQHDQLLAQRDALREALEHAIIEGLQPEVDRLRAMYPDTYCDGQCWLALCQAKDALALCEPKDKEGGMV